MYCFALFCFVFGLLLFCSVFCLVFVCCVVVRVVWLFVDVFVCCCLHVLFLGFHWIPKYLCFDLMLLCSVFIFLCCVFVRIVLLFVDVSVVLVVCVYC